MSKSENPTDFTAQLPRAQKQWTLSVHKVLNGQIDQGTPTSKDATGNWNQFQNPNTSGILIRIGANGTTSNKYIWGASNTAITINHGLGRQPIGVRLESSDAALNIYQTQTPDTNNVYVAPSNNAANATIYIF